LSERVVAAQGCYDESLREQEIKNATNVEGPLSAESCVDACKRLDYRGFQYAAIQVSLKQSLCCHNCKILKFLVELYHFSIISLSLGII